MGARRGGVAEMVGFCFDERFVVDDIVFSLRIHKTFSMATTRRSHDNYCRSVSLPLGRACQYSYFCGYRFDFIYCIGDQNTAHPRCEYAANSGGGRTGFPARSGSISFLRGHCKGAVWLSSGLMAAIFGFCGRGFGCPHPQFYLLVANRVDI